MSEITPNTPNPVREDAYKTELAEKLGIDPQYIPKSPVWRNEEEIKAIAEMFANMQGGGSSGGGVLVVKFTSGRDGLTCDKTYAEIVSAITSGTPVMCLTPNSETGNVNYHQYTQAVNALFFDEGDSTLDVTTLTIDSSNSIAESVHSITLT